MRAHWIGGFLASGAVIVALIVHMYGKPLLQQAFPVRYGEYILDAAEATGIDPILLVAMIQVESRFDPGAHSAKGARGLMQVIPSTAEQVAGQLGLTDFGPEQLYEPQTNVLIGAAYIRYLKNLFDDELPVALAAYNGGLGNVRRWLNDGVWSGRIEDIGDIPFDETRNYVRRVHEWYHFYRDLYPELATASSSFPPVATPVDLSP